MPAWFESVPKVTTGATLAAFIIAAVLTAYAQYLRYRMRVINTAPDKERPKLVNALNEFFGVDTTELSPKDQYKLALAQVQARLRRFYVMAAVTVVVALILAYVSIHQTIESVSFEGDLGTLVAGLKAGSNSPVVTIADDLEHFWVDATVADTEVELIQKICASNLCLNCSAGKPIIHISVDGPLQSFRDSNGATFRECRI